MSKGVDERFWFVPNGDRCGYDAAIFRIGGLRMPKNEQGAYYSDHINRRVTQSIFDAVDFAVDKNLALNWEVVINLHESEAKAAATLFENIRDRFRVWLNYRAKKDGQAVPPVYIYTLEDSNADRPHPHANWLVHVPDAYAAEFRRKLPRWVKRAQGEAGPFDIHCESIKADYVKRLAKYVVKGTDPVFVNHFYLADMAAAQGRIYGRRAGVSPSLAQTARKAAGFKRKRKSFPGWTPSKSAGSASPAPVQVAHRAMAARPGRPSWRGSSAIRESGRPSASLDRA